MIKALKKRKTSKSLGAVDSISKLERSTEEGPRVDRGIAAKRQQKQDLNPSLSNSKFHPPCPPCGQRFKELCEFFQDCAKQCFLYPPVCGEIQMPWQEQLSLEGWVVELCTFQQLQKHFRD